MRGEGNPLIQNFFLFLHSVETSTNVTFILERNTSFFKQSSNC